MNDIKNVLVAFDGSEQSLLAVKYLSGILSPKRTLIDLFHVSVDIPESFMDMEKMELLFGHSVTSPRKYFPN